MVIKIQDSLSVETIELYLYLFLQLTFDNVPPVTQSVKSPITSWPSAKENNNCFKHLRQIQILIKAALTY